MTDLNEILYKEIVKDIFENKLNKYDAKDKLVDILDKYNVNIMENDPNRYEIKANIEKFINDRKRQGASHNTIKNYTLQLNLFDKYFNNWKIQDIQKQNVLDYLDHKEHRCNVKRTTLESIRSVLRTFFVWLEDEKIIDTNPIIKIKPYKLPRHIVKTLSLEELEDIREYCKTLRERCLIELLYSSGCRLNELTQLNINDLNWNNRSIKVLGKGNKERVVFFSTRAFIHIKKYLKSRTDDCEALFVTERKPHRRVSNRAVQREVKLIGRRVGISDLHCHQFRRTTSNIMLNNGADIYVVKEILGHDDINTTLRNYSNISEDYKRQSYDKYLIQ